MFKLSLLAKALIVLAIVSVLISACGAQASRIDKPGKPEAQVQGLYTYDLADGKWTLTVIAGDGFKVEIFNVVTQEGTSQTTTEDDGDLSSGYAGSKYSHSVELNDNLKEGYLDTPLKYQDGKWVRFTFFVNGEECDWVEILPDSKNFPITTVNHTFACNMVITENR